MRDPEFWWRPFGLWSGLLAPLGTVYGAIVTARMAAPGTRASVPVLCVGNFTLGGAGKTPLTIWLTKLLADAGEKPFCLSRGYGGRATGPNLVDATAGSAADVGDEALLLARAAPTVVSKDRVAGAQFAAAQGATVIVMDDGLQNASLVKDFTIAAIDAGRGVGNGLVFPAGPLRAPLKAQFAYTDALLAIGEAAAVDAIAKAAPGLPLFHGRLIPDAAAVQELQARKVLAFAGIGNPDKFFATAEQAGIAVAQRRRFGDHYRFSAEDAAALTMDAERDGLTLLTTEKDRARMTGDPALASFAASVKTLPVTLAVEHAEALRALIMAALRR
jgi:tetraacyldisaccharide 4'-kinase